MAEIIVNRKNQHIYSLRGFNVVLNGYKVGKISSGESKSWNVDPGQHTLQVKIDIYSSKVLEFQVSGNEKVTFHVEVDENMMNAFSFSKGNYVLLTMEGDDKKAVEQSPIQPPQRTQEPTMPKRKDGAIFISYRRQDSPNSTGRIYDRLIAKYGKDSVFKDVDNIPLGVDFREYLSEYVGKCRVLLVIIGDEWLGEKGMPNRLMDERDYVRIEIESALQRNIPVIPILVRDARMPQKDNLPDSLQALQYRNGLEVRPDPDFSNDMNKLIGELNSIVGH